MIVATRTLTVKTKAGEEKPVEIRLFAPTRDGESWDCRYEIDWPADGWPAQTTRSHAMSLDGIQALHLVLQKIGLDLHFTSYHRERTMWWLENGAGYGFPVPRDARDLLIGDDAKYYGEG